MLGFHPMVQQTNVVSENENCVCICQLEMSRALEKVCNKWKILFTKLTPVNSKALRWSSLWIIKVLVVNNIEHFGDFMLKDTSFDIFILTWCIPWQQQLIKLDFFLSFSKCSNSSCRSIVLSIVLKNLCLQEFQLSFFINLELCDLKNFPLCLWLGLLLLLVLIWFWINHFRITYFYFLMCLKGFPSCLSLSCSHSLNL